MAYSEDDDAVTALAVPIFPPRPDAICTLLTSNDFLPGAQTLLYSVKKSLPADKDYPPELIVIVTHNVTTKTRAALHPAFCTRIIEVEPICFPPNSINKRISSNLSWDSCGLTKLHIFSFDVYDTLVYLDADCLVVEDVCTPLLELGKVYVQSEALIAAAPDIFPPDKFNAGVLVVRPSKAVFENMMGQRSLLRTYDGGDTGFLNAYFSDWYRDMPPMARLPFGYNAQRFLFACTYEKQPNYWDLAVAPDLKVIHYSSTPKPWETLQPLAMDEKKQPPVAAEHLDEEAARCVQESGSKSMELDQIWRRWYQRSRNYAIKFHNERNIKARQRHATLMDEKRNKATNNSTTSRDPKEMHKLVTKRFKQLRRQGESVRDAMKRARQELGADKDDSKNPGAQVAAMFGMPY